LLGIKFLKIKCIEQLLYLRFVVSVGVGVTTIGALKLFISLTLKEHIVIDGVGVGFLVEVIDTVGVTVLVNVGVLVVVFVIVGVTVLVIVGVGVFVGVYDGVGVTVEVGVGVMLLK
jgi:hypothetical protein